MSEKLYKFGQWSFNNRWKVIGVWLIALISISLLAFNFSKTYDSKIFIPGTEAQVAIDKLSKEFPQLSKGSSTVVFAVTDGQKITNYADEINQIVSDISKIDGVSAANSPFISKTISENGRIAFATIQLDTEAEKITTETKEKLLNTIETGRTNNLQIELKGDVIVKSSQAPVGESIGVVIAAVVLFMTFSSIVAAGLPLVIAFLSVAFGMLGVLVATYVFNLSSTTPVLATMLGLAVGIDYVLFIIVRYIKNLKSGQSPVEATGRSVATAGNAVIFAALTVIIALSALSVTGIPFLTAMGLAGAFTVGIAALASVTLLPALLSFVKYKVLKKQDRKSINLIKSIEDTQSSPKSFAYKWVSFLTKNSIVVLILCFIGLGAIAVPATKMQLGLPNDSTAASESTQRKAYELLTEGFGAGFNAPLLVITDMPENYSKIEQQKYLAAITKNITNDSNVSAALLGGVSPNGKIGILQVYPKTGPNDTETKELISRLRNNSEKSFGSENLLQVSGSTAIAVDIDSKLAKAFPIYVTVVVGLSLIILLAVFRSIVVPIKATLGFLLTIFATFGTIVMLFQWGWFGIFAPGPILSFLPILVTGILFGLAMDYQFFLVSGMHEEYMHGNPKDAKSAVVNGFSHGAKVVTVAAIIMASVFAGFIFTDDNIVKSIGFALTIGVIVDAFIVRMTIVPAVMSLFGKKAWYLPKWLDRIIPNLSIEGDESAFDKK